MPPAPHPIHADIKWVTITKNHISGVAPSNPGICGSINATNPLSSDLLVERNEMSCPPGNFLPCGDGICVTAANSVVAH